LDLAPLDRVRALCMALPQATERLSHGEPTWFVGTGKSFANFADNHHGAGRVAIWCAAPPGMQNALVGGDPDRYFVPPYFGYRGWLGVRVDGDPDWEEIAGVLEDAHATVAPKRLLAALRGRQDEAGSSGPALMRTGAAAGRARRSGSGR
jgi:hypothetical protein